MYGYLPNIFFITAKSLTYTTLKDKINDHCLDLYIMYEEFRLLYFLTRKTFFTKVLTKLFHDK